MQQRISFAICAFSSENLVRLALGELGSTTGGFQTVLLLLAEPKTLDIQGFLASLSDFNP